MHDRITHRLVTFLHPFSLAGVEGERPAGTYEVETTEAPINGLSLLGYRRVSTTIDLPSNRSAMLARQRIGIDPRDLEAAEKRDAAMEAARPAGASATQVAP
jgi:hypothetical protein